MSWLGRLRAGAGDSTEALVGRGFGPIFGLKRPALLRESDRTMAKLKRLGVVFSAKLQAIQWAIAGLFAGVLYSFGGLIFELFTGSLNSGTAIAFLALLGMPAMFAAIGFIAGAIGAFLYNSYAKWGGGIEIDLEQEG